MSCFVLIMLIIISIIACYIVVFRCAMGTVKEMLVFLFLLFAEQPATERATMSWTSSQPSRIKSSKGPGDRAISRKSTKIATVNTSGMSIDSGSDNFSVDTDATGSTTSTIGRSSHGSTTNNSNRLKGNTSYNASKKGSSTLDVVPEQRDGDDENALFENPGVEKGSSYIELTQKGLESMLQFCALWQLIWDDEIADQQANYVRSFENPNASSNSSPKPTMTTKLESIVGKARTNAATYVSLIESIIDQQPALQVTGQQIKASSAAVMSTPTGSPRSHHAYPLTLKRFLLVAQQVSQISPPNVAVSSTGSFTNDSFGPSLLSVENLQRALRIFNLTTPPVQVS